MIPLYFLDEGFVSLQSTVHETSFTAQEDALACSEACHVHWLMVALWFNNTTQSLLALTTLALLPF